MRGTGIQDLVAGLIVSLMLSRMRRGYARLAVLSPWGGLYASVAPLLLCAMCGTGRVLGVGRGAVVWLMTAAAIGGHAAAGTPADWAVAITLAFLSGAMLLLMGILRLGFLAHFLSHPVISGFISAYGLLIAARHLKTLMGGKAARQNFL